MNLKNKLIYYTFSLLMAAVIITPVFAAEKAKDATPGYNQKIPESIMTPDTVETMVGTLEFFDGIPNEKSAKAPSGRGTSVPKTGTFFSWSSVSRSSSRYCMIRSISRSSVLK